MVDDFTPVRSSLASGVVIKQNILERNRQKPPDVETSLHDYTGSIESGFISGGAGGSFNSLNVLGSSPEGQSQGFVNSITPYVTQSWSTIIDSPAGQLAVTQSSQDEFYNGELSGSAFTVTDGNLNTIEIATAQASDFVFTSNYDDNFGYSNQISLILDCASDDPPTNGRFRYLIYPPTSEGSVVNLVFSPLDSDGIDRSSYFSSLQAGNSITVRLRSSTGTQPSQIFTITSVDTNFYSYGWISVLTAPHIFPATAAIWDFYKSNNGAIPSSHC